MFAIRIVWFCACVSAWSNEEFALYDLVEEIEGDFYSFFTITKDASLSEIKKAYRRLSMEWHPDRNGAENAPDTFRKIAAVYEILKSTELREKYNFVLENGLPDWRQPVYYIRRARKLSWYETLLALLLICTTGHYLMLWGTYIDKYLTLSSNKGKLRKKEIRQLKRTGVTDAEELQEARIADQLTEFRPRLKQLLPILIASLVFDLFKNLPIICKEIYEEFNRRNLPHEVEEVKEVFHFTPAVIQPVYEYEVASDIKPISSSPVETMKNHNKDVDSELLAIKRNQKWTCEELTQLITLSTEKYPVGSLNRWEKMAKILKRSPEDVTAMAGKLKHINKDEFAKVLRKSQTSAVTTKAAKMTAIETVEPELEEENETKIEPHRTPLSTLQEPESLEVGDVWTQRDQRLLEIALQQFPKGTADRWEKIVNCVPNKTKQQCMERFKYLSEMVRQRKAQHRNKK